MAAFSVVKCKFIGVKCAILGDLQASSADLNRLGRSLILNGYVTLDQGCIGASGRQMAPTFSRSPIACSCK